MRHRSVTSFGLKKHKGCVFTRDRHTRTTKASASPRLVTPARDSSSCQASMAYRSPTSARTILCKHALRFLFVLIARPWYSGTWKNLSRHPLYDYLWTSKTELISSLPTLLVPKTLSWRVLPAMSTVSSRRIHFYARKVKWTAHPLSGRLNPRAVYSSLLKPTQMDKIARHRTQGRARTRQRSGPRRIRC